MDFLLEVGTEELPADFVDSAIAQLQERVSKSLETESLDATAIQVYATPRRLAVLITGLPREQEDRSEEIKGPPVSAAYKNGQITPAGEGFARKQGVSTDAFSIRTTDKGEFVYIEKTIPGRQTAEILTELIPQWITRLEGRRFMRWGDGDLRFPRPIRWLLTLVDGEVLPLELINGSTTLTSDRLTFGHRILHPQSLAISHPQAYLTSLRSIFVEADPQVRQQIITDQITTLAKTLEGVAEIPADLLAEVTNLVEYPTAIVGKFDDEFLELPPEVIITVMVTHQRYFPVKTKQGLSPYFITISNGDPQKSEIISAGNERVIRARLADARFFYTADCDEPLDSFLPQLENVTFQEELGTMRDKVDRIMEIAQMIVEQLNLDEQSRSDIESTAMLCKADLVTQMVSADFNINLLALIEQIAQDFVTSHPDKPNPVNLIKDFFLQRLQTLLIDDLSIDYDLVNAVLGENDPEYKSRALENLLDTRERARFLSQIRQDGQLANIYETVNRSTRLAQKGDLDTTTLEAKAIINTELFEQSSESAFYNALIALIPETISAREQRDYQRLLTALTAISPLVADFFDGENSVLVMAEKESVRRNRLNLLGLLRNHARVLADFGAIVKG